MRRFDIAALALAFAACVTTPTPPPVEKIEPTDVEPPKPPDPEAWRAEKPKPGEAPVLKAPTFEKGVLKNGLEVWVSERHELPVVSLALAFRAGSGTDPKGKGGLADLTYGMLLEGAGKYDALQLADAFGDLGVTASKSSDLDGASITLTALKRNADPALALLADVAQKPKFAKDDFDRKKKQQLADLAAQIGNPYWLTRVAVVAAVFGDDHPYGHPASGLPATVNGLTLDDVKKFYKDSVGPAATALVVTGDVTLGEASAWAEKYFAGWKSAAAVPAAATAPALEARKNIVFVPKAGLSQTVVIAARPGIPSGHPDYEPLLIADGVYGGNFSSRLNMNLREAKGYTYGAFSNVQPRRGTGWISAGASVRADVTGASITEVFAEMKGLKDKPVTKDELENSRESIVRSIPGWFETVEALAGSAASLYWRDLPLDRFEKFIAALQAADAATVQALAEKYYDPSLMKIVLVGDPDTVEKQVPPLAMGEIVKRPAPEMPAAPAAAPSAGKK